MVDLSGEAWTAYGGRLPSLIGINRAITAPQVPASGCPRTL
jgi:hypothetical protein